MRPYYFLDFVGGVLSAIVSDPVVTLLAIGSIFAALATTVYIGFAIFFLLYAILRTVNTVANAIGNGALHLSHVAALANTDPATRNN